jgi:hypothetical protein
VKQVWGSRIVALVACPLLLAAVSENDPRAYETEYDVTTTVQPDGWQTHPIKRGDIIFKQRLSFASLAVADVALADAANGEEFVPSAEQYFKAATNGPNLWCTANMKWPNTGFARDVIGRVYSQYCILDENNDGVFESFFKRARTIQVLPNVRGKITPNPRAIRPLRLTSVDPATLKTDYFVGVEFLGAHGKDSAFPDFQAVAGSQYGGFPLEGGYERGTAATTQQVAFIDKGLIEVAKTPDGFSAKLVRPFRAGTQRIRATDCGIINGC